jgi:hypothetical protein
VAAGPCFPKSNLIWRDHFFGQAAKKVSIKRTKMLPTITIRANATIFNGEYCFPTNGIADSDCRPIIETCKLTLQRLGVAVLFAKNAMTIFVEDEQRLREGKYRWLDHLVNFIVYRSRVDYRGYCNYVADEARDFDNCTEVIRVLTFNLERLNWEQGIKKVGERYVALGSEPCRLEIERAEFDEFHKLIDTTLAVAIAYFLVASENPQYFLVEYYKCFEVIKQELGGESAMFDALRPHGFSKKMFKTLTGDANAQRMPIAFGRHTPKKGANIIGIDLRSLHSPTFQRELFDKSTSLCRAGIDAYVSYLLTRA